jgi:hypothetical protein
MDFTEINNLINIRNYITTIINSPNIDRPTVSELSGILLLSDKKIVDILKSSEFKEYIGYKNVKKTIEDVVRLNNIRSGIIK